MGETRDRVVEVRCFGGPDRLGVVEAPGPMVARVRCRSACSPRIWSTPM